MEYLDLLNEYISLIKKFTNTSEEAISDEKINNWINKVKESSEMEEFQLSNFTKEWTKEIGRIATPQWEEYFEVFFPRIWGLEAEEIPDLAMKTAEEIFKKLKQELSDFKENKIHAISQHLKLGNCWYIFREYVIENKDNPKIKKWIEELIEIDSEMELLKKDFYFSENYTIIIKNIVAVTTIKSLTYTMATFVTKKLLDLRGTPLSPYTELMGFGNIYIGKNVEKMLRVSLFELETEELKEFLIFPIWEKSKILTESYSLFNKIYNDNSGNFGFYIEDWSDYA